MDPAHRTATVVTAPPPWGAWPIVRPVRPARRWALAFLYAFALLPLTVVPRHSGNVFSRYMTIEALVERGELAIERSPLLIPSGSPDLVRFGSHLYSDKPPVLPVLASPVYAILYVGGGVRFAGPGNQFVLVNLALTWAVAGLASALAVFWVLGLLQAADLPPWASDLLALVGVGFTTPLLSYAVTFNNHSVAAGLIAGAVATTVLPSSGAGRRGGFLAGLLVALAATLDMPAGGLMLLGLLAIQARRARGVPWGFVAGVVGPILLHAGLQSRVTGSPLPAEAYPEAFQYPGSYWSTPAGTWHEHAPRARFALEQLIGPQGWLTITPALMVGLVELARTAARRGDPLRPAALAILGAVVGLVGFYTWGVRRLDFGGSSFGTRHLLALTPLVYSFAGIGLARARWKGAFAAGLIALSVMGLAYALAGMRDPWRRAEAAAKTDLSIGLLQSIVPIASKANPVKTS